MNWSRHTCPVTRHLIFYVDGHMYLEMTDLAYTHVLVTWLGSILKIERAQVTSIRQMG